MTVTRSGWRMVLAAAAAASALMASTGTGLGGGGQGATAGGGAQASYGLGGREILPFAVLVRTPRGPGPEVVVDEHRHHRNQRALGADATSVQVQQPGDPLPGSARWARQLRRGRTGRCRRRILGWTAESGRAASAWPDPQGCARRARHRGITALGPGHPGHRRTGLGRTGADTIIRGTAGRRPAQRRHGRHLVPATVAGRAGRPVAGAAEQGHRAVRGLSRHRGTHPGRLSQRRSRIPEAATAVAAPGRHRPPCPGRH